MIRKLKAIFPAMMALKPHTLQESQAHFIERQDMFAPFRAPSKTRSFISILTLFCFLSQSFASILWANPLPEANHRFYREGFVGLHIVPERDGKGHIQGLRVTMSMLEADGNSSPQNAVLQDMPTDSKPKDPSADIKTVVSTVLKIGDNTQEQSLQNLVPQTMQACAQALKDVFFIVDDLGNVSLTSRNIPCDSTDTLSSSGINKNIFIDITEGVTFKNVNKANVCVRAASLKFLGSDNQIQTLDFHKASPASNITSAGDKNHQGMWVDENARLDVKTLRLGSGATFWNDGATTVGQLTGDNASILNDGTLTGFLEGSFDRLQNGSNKEVCTAEYHGTVKGSVTHLHNYNVMNLGSTSHVRVDTFSQDHHKAVFKNRGLMHAKTLTAQGKTKIQTLNADHMMGQGRMEIDNLSAKTLNIAARATLTTTTCSVDSLDNAGTLKVQDSLTYTKTFKNKESGKANVKGLSFKPVKAIATPLTHDLENEGQLDLHQVNQTHAPKRMVNHKTGTFMLHDNQGIWDDAAFEDLGTDKVTFVQGLTLNHLTNKGTFQLWDGVYDISDIHNTKDGVFIRGHQDHASGKLQYTSFTNEGTRKAPNGLRLKNEFSFGKLESDKPLTLLYSKGYNAADALRNDQIQAPSLKVHAHTLTGQNVEGKGDMTVKNLTATTLKISAQSALTTETCHVDTVENAGTLKVQDSLTYTKTFKNKETAKADVKGLSFKPVKAIATPLTHDLENEGQLDLHQVNQSYAPKRMVNHKTGTFMLHDNQGIWDDAAFADLETDKVTFVKGLTLDHLTNKGTFQFWDGVYEISDIHNTESGIFTYSGPTQKLGHLHHKAFKNDGVRKAPNGLRLKNAKAIGRMESDKPLTLLFSKGVNAADALRNHQIQAPSLEIKGDMFHNPRGVDLKLSFDKTDAAGLTQTVLMPLQLDVKSFTNGGRMIAGSLGLTAHTFKQTDMAMITTLGDITMTVQGEVNNKVGQIQSRGKTYIRSINGDILVGDRGVREGYVYKRNGAFIEGGTHLILQAGKAINAGFGQLFLTGQRLDQATFDDQPLVHLKANQILLEAALIYATGSIYFETPRFSSHLSPWARHNDYLANVHHSNWYNGDHWAYTEKISCQIPEIISGADIIFDSASALLQATRVAARGNIVKKTEDQIAPCSTTNPQGLNLQDVTYYFYGWRGGRAGEPLGKELKGRYPTTLLSGTDINIEDRGFRATGLVGLFGANVRLIIGDQLSIHGAQGTLFPMAVEHTAHPKGVLTNLSGAAQRLQSARFMPTSDAQKLLQQKPASGAVITASLPLVQVQNSSSPVLTVNLPQNQVPFLLSGSYFVGESIDKNALTFLGLKGELLEIPAPGQLAQAKVSALTLEEARELPMLLSMRDWEMCYDLAHSGALFSTFSHHTLRETMARANHYAHNRGMLDVSDWQQMTEPCSAFAIVHYGGVRYLSLESYTPASYYQDHMRIHKAAIVAMNGDVNIVSRNAYIEQTHIMAIKDRQKALPDRALNQVEMLEDAPFQDTPAQKTLSTDHATRNTADETPASQGGNIRIMAKETLFTRDMDTTADKNTIMFGQQFAAVFGGEHQARKFYTASQGPVMVGGSEYCREIHIDTKNYKFHEIDRRFLPAIIRATQARFESFGAHDITFVGTHIYAPSQVITRGGKVHFKVGTDTYYSYRFEDDSDAFMTDISTSTHHRVTHHYPKITAPMQIEGAEQVLIDRIQKANGSISGGGFFTQMAQALSDQLQEKQASMPPFMDLLKGIDPDILEFTLAREVDRYTSENISGPGPAVMGIVAVAAAVLTYGAGASAFSAAGLTLESTSAIAAANAGFSALASQAAVSTLQNEGDIGKVLKDLASTRTVKNVAIAAVTGGLCDAALSAMGISEAAAGATEVVEAAAGSSAASSGVSASTLSAQTLHQSMQLTKEMMDMARYAAEAVAQQAISASVSHALGERGGFKNFAQVAFAQALMRYGLGKVDGLNLDDLSEKIAHTATGAAFGGILGGEKGAISGAMGALIANTVTNQACDLGLAPDTARKMGAIASALPAFWDDYNLHIGSSAGQASAGAAAQSQSRKLAEKIEQDKQAGDLKRLEEALLEKARIEAEQALKAKEGHADEKQKAASQNGSSSLQKKTKPLTPADKANLVSVLTAAPSLQAEEPLQNPHLLGNLHQQETVIHTDQARREAVAEHLVQGFKDIERGRVHGGHRRSLSGDICLIRASAHLGAQQTWNVLAEQEAQQFANMGYFNGMVNFRGGGSDMPAVPMVLPEPVYNTEAARKAFRTGLMDGHTTVGDSGKHLIDMAVPGGIDYGLAYAKGEITKSQLVAAQSAAIAGELAAGYVAGKVVKGVAKGAERVARFASELKTGKTLRARSVPVISYHGLEETILDGANPKNRFLHENQKIIYRRDMQRPYARDPKLRENLEELHRDSGIVGSGSTAAALREEIRTGTKVGGKDHYQKAEDGITYLKKWLTNNPTAYSGDRAAAENVLKDLLDAVKGVKQ